MTVAAAELEPEVRQTEFDEIWSIITDEVPGYLDLFSGGRYDLC